MALAAGVKLLWYSLCAIQRRKPVMAPRSRQQVIRRRGRDTVHSAGQMVFVRLAGRHARFLKRVEMKALRTPRNLVCFRICSFNVLFMSCLRFFVPMAYITFR